VFDASIEYRQSELAKRAYRLQQVVVKLNGLVYCKIELIRIYWNQFVK